jgi:hypothetical protein
MIFRNADGLGKFADREEDSALPAEPTAQPQDLQRIDEQQKQSGRTKKENGANDG